MAQGWFNDAGQLSDEECDDVAHDEDSSRRKAAQAVSGVQVA